MKTNIIMQCMSVRMVVSEAEAVTLAVRGIFTMEQLLKYGEISHSDIFHQHLLKRGVTPFKAPLNLFGGA